MRFHISTILLTIACVSISLGWYLDRCSRESIVSNWYYPSLDLPQSEYQSALLIHRDGSFQKVQTFRFREEVFSGNYFFIDDETIVFQFDQFTEQNRKSGKLTGNVRTEQMDAGFTFRYSISRSGHLLISPFGLPHQLGGGRILDIRWETAMAPQSGG